ncbi:MAG TPA: sulfotransferase [Solirubrobacteraceae bacterium]|nr:sulfotransferase [Solirubrobacteraceae bacterium]
MTVAAGQRTPDFFIVGHHKCGTTALYEMLRGHPQIYMPECKEPKFLATDLPARREPSAARMLPRTLAEYLALFAPAEPGQRAGEASPQYLRSRTAARRIAELRPDARIVAILREPASFLRSLHLQLVENHVERERDLRRALARDEREDGEGGDGAARRGVRYSEHVRYVEQLRRFHAVFPREQVLVLIYDDFRADNAGTVRRVLRFLGVDDTVRLAPREANPSVRVRSPRLDDAVHALYAGRGPGTRALKRGARLLVPRRARRGALRAVRRGVAYGAPEPPDEQLMDELRRRYRDEVHAVSEYLGRDLVELWGYGGLG